MVVVVISSRSNTLDRLLYNYDWGDSCVLVISGNCTNEKSIPVGYFKTTLVVSRAEVALEVPSCVQFFLFLVY
jgi:hypothetical protein